MLYIFLIVFNTLLTCEDQNNIMHKPKIKN